MSTSFWLRAGGTAGALGAIAGAGAWTAKTVLDRQAAHARHLIGKPLGEEALVADRTFGKEYGDPVELLLLGDSTAAGLGAEKPKQTLGARLSKRVVKRSERSVRLTTGARVGSESSMLMAQIEGLPRSYRPDVAVILVGGNDVTHRVPTTVAAKHLAEVIEELHDLGAEVVVGTCPDLRALEQVPQPLRSLASRASRQLAEAQRRTAIAHGDWAVSLADVVGPFFLTNPDEMFSLDGFHPSPSGYKRTAKALVPSVLAAMGAHDEELPFGHHAPWERAAQEAQE